MRAGVEENAIAPGVAHMHVAAVRPRAVEDPVAAHRVDHVGRGAPAQAVAGRISSVARFTSYAWISPLRAQQGQIAKKQGEAAARLAGGALGGGSQALGGGSHRLGGGAAPSSAPTVLQTLCNGCISRRVSCRSSQLSLQS